MQNYKDLQGKLHVLDSEEFEYLLPIGCEKITDEEAYQLSNPQLTLAQIASKFEADIQEYLDGQAQLKGYDNITTACSYAAAPNPFQTEAISFVTWRGNVWHYCYGELAKVEAGTRSMPKVEQIISELPVRA